MKVLSWVIALGGLWEFGDIAALFVPDFGKIPAHLWNHIIVGLILMIVGAWATQTSNAGIARTLHWIGCRCWLMADGQFLYFAVSRHQCWAVERSHRWRICLHPGCLGGSYSPRVTG